MGRTDDATGEALLVSEALVALWSFLFAVVAVCFMVAVTVERIVADVYRVEDCEPVSVAELEDEQVSP